MEDWQIARILHQFHSRKPQEAWSEFLQLYSPVILQVVRLFERDADHAADCFLFVCEQLSRRQFHRLRRFRLRGPARFSTWLRAVVRNLCLDWHRKEFGRQRVFQSIACLPRLERESFRCMYERGLSFDESLLSLQTRFPTLTREQLAETQERIQQCLTPRQLWLLSTGKHKAETVVTGLADKEGPLQQQVPDSRPDPEALTVLKERRAALARALSRLSKPERLLIRLRFGQGLTLEEVARVTRLGDAQRAERRIREILERLRKDIT